MRFRLDPLSPGGVAIAPEPQKVVARGGYAGSPDITRVLRAGTNVTLTGSGTQQSPYVINSTGGGGGASPLTTKGDLYGYSTADARIPVGADGTVLTADSTQGVGVKWAAVSGTGTVTSVTSADANATVANTTTTPVITIVSAPKLLTARTVQTNLASTSSASFDGSANITPGVTGTLPVTNGGTGSATKNFVDLTTNQTVAGAKTFSNPVGLSPQSPSYVANTLVADSANDSLTYYNSDPNVSLQVGQEEWIRVINNTGSTIANGAAVYLSGASGSLPTIALAKSDAGTTTICAGLATESIANGATGFVTCIGNVNGLDTSAFTAGQTVYVSATTAGGLTATAPLAPNFRYRIGIVGVSSATVGTIHVTPSTASLGNGTANQLFGINTAGTGQELKSLVAGSNVTITPGIGTLTIAATSGSGTTNNFNTTKVDQSGGGTTTYGALAGLINGSNAVYTVSNGAYVSGTLQVLLNGQEQTLGSTGDYTETAPGSGTFTFTIAPATSSIIICSYITQISTSGNLAQPITTKTASYTINATTDNYIRADATSGAQNQTLPTASTSTGLEFIIKKIDSSVNAVTVVGTIDGATNYSLASQYKYLRVRSNGTSYDNVGNN